VHEPNDRRSRPSASRRKSRAAARNSDSGRSTCWRRCSRPAPARALVGRVPSVANRSPAGGRRGLADVWSCFRASSTSTERSSADAGSQLSRMQPSLNASIGSPGHRAAAAGLEDGEAEIEMPG
jgi:hypothetical protein